MDAPRRQDLDELNPLTPPVTSPVSLSVICGTPGSCPGMNGSLEFFAK
jgi:hypothetical protein